MSGDSVQEQFKQDMEDSGFEVELYQGRGFYKGWAVRVREREQEQDVIRATTVEIQSDSMGLGRIIYPTRSMSQEKFAEEDKKEGDMQ